MTQTLDLELPHVQRLSRDIAKASVTLSEREVRYLVDIYYGIQKYRVASGNQLKELVKSEEPHDVIAHVSGEMEVLESQIKRALDKWTSGQPLSVWAKSIVGIGPVIAAGLAAHIDIAQAPTVGHIWRFAGLDPTSVWARGEKRPWNGNLKTICWKVGESFRKFSGEQFTGAPEGMYGRLYLIRRRLEWERNLSGAFAEQARESLQKKNFRKSTDAHAWYSGSLQPKPDVVAATVIAEPLVWARQAQLFTKVGAGEGVEMLPPSRIQLRAQRYATKLFLAHYHHVGYELMYGQPPPKPYVLDHLGHVDFIAPPNWPMAGG